MTGSPFDKLLLAPDSEILPSVRKFNRWLVRAKPRSILCYARDMWGHKSPRNMKAVARAVWVAYEAGTVELVQRRNKQGTIDYLAIKRRNPR
jgi:hypothetical protein